MGSARRQTCRQAQHAEKTRDEAKKEAEASRGMILLGRVEAPTWLHRVTPCYNMLQHVTTNKKNAVFEAANSRLKSADAVYKAASAKLSVC